MGQDTKPAASVQTTTTDGVNENNAESLLLASFAESDESNAGTRETTTTPESNAGEVNDATDTDATDTVDENDSGNNEMDNKDTDSTDDSTSETDNPFEKSARGWQKRVNKLTAQKKAKDDEIELLKREIQELKSGRSSTQQQQPKAKNPVDDVSSLEQLDDLANRTRAERDKVLEMLSTDAPDFEVGDEIYTREQILGYLKILNADLDEAIPTKRKALSFQAEVQSKAKANDDLIAKNFPDFKEGSAEDEWIKEQLSDQFFEANKKILLHYAWRGLTQSQVETKYKADRAKATKKLPSAPATSASVSPASHSNLISKDGSLDRGFAAKLLFEN